MGNPPVKPLFDLRPWDQNPQSLLRTRARTTLRGSGVNQQAAFIDNFWGAEAHRYAKCTNLVFPVSTTSIRILDAPDNYRNLLSFRNLDLVNTAYLAFGNDANANSAFQLGPMGFLLLDVVVPQDDIYAISSAGTINLAVTISTIVLPPMPPI